MPQAIGAIAVAAGASAATTATIVTLSYMAMAAFTLFGALSAANKRRPEGNQSDGRLLNGKSTQAPISVIYGTMRVGGNHVYMNATGINNDILHIVQTLGEGEISGVQTLLLDDKEPLFFGSNLQTEFFTGSAGQTVCQALALSDPLWNDALRNTAYIYLRLGFDPNKFLNLPLITAVVSGIKVYDPRVQQTVWSDNFAVCIYDLMRNSRYGIGISGDDIDEDSVIDFANWCDLQGYKCNLALTERDNALDVLMQMLTSCRGYLVYGAGKYALRAYDYDSAVMDLTEDDIAADSFAFTVPGIQETPNAIRVKYINEDNNYVLEDLILHDTQAIDLDGETREQTFELLGVTKYNNAYKIALYLLERKKLGRVYTFTAGPKAIPLEAGDIVRITHSLPGWTNQSCRVIDATVFDSHTVALSVMEEAAEIYDDEINVVTHGSNVTNLPDPLSIPPPPANVVITEETYVIKDNSFSRLKIVWDAPVYYPFLEYVEVWISKDGGITYSHYTDAIGSVTIDNLVDGEQLYLKFRSVSINGRRDEMDHISAYFFTITGKATLPDDVTGFQGTAAGDTILLRWIETSMEDLAGYEIRYGASWGTSIYFGFTKSQTFSMVGVKPGVHSFAIKSKDTAGNYSATAAVTTVTVAEPPGYTQFASNTVDYETQGTHTDTEFYNDPTHGDSLRIQTPHLAGSYESPSYDLGSKRWGRHWLNYEINVNATGATWAGGIGDTTWDTVISEGETWVQHFANVQAGTFRAKLCYSDNNADWTEIDYFEILSVELETRYIKYRVLLDYNDLASSIYVEPITLKSYWR